MRAIRSEGRAERLRQGVGVVLALAVATGLVAALEVGLAIDNASSVYLLAVAAIAIRWGTTAAVATAVGAFLLYNLLFVEPRITLTVARPEELVMLLLLLFLGVLIGRLAGRQRDRERLAQLRERESRALFGITRELATAQRLPIAMQAIVERLAAETGLARGWIGLGPTQAQERVVADTARGEPVPVPGTHAILHRGQDDREATWTRVHPTSAPARGAPVGHGRALYRVELRIGNEGVGSLWCVRDAAAGDFVRGETRLLAAAADQLAQAVRRDHLATTAAEVEIARRTEELRGALLDSVSHDLRTPLASIRAAAGSIADPTIELSVDARRAAAQSIDREAERLNRLVGTLLDMSRIQAGSLVADLEIVPLTELVEPVVARMRERLASHPVSVDIAADLPSVRVDATFLTQALLNLLENVQRHTPEGAPVAIRAARNGHAAVSLVVEDGGPGVSGTAIPHLFERFYRADDGSGASRGSFGLGLAVVRGLVEAMGGTVRAGHGSLGGLAITMELPAGSAEPSP